MDPRRASFVGDIGHNLFNFNELGRSAAVPGHFPLTGARGAILVGAVVELTLAAVLEVYVTDAGRVTAGPSAG